MDITIGKIIALVAAIGIWIATLVVTREVGSAIVMSLPLVFILSLIWFPERWGEWTLGRITHETPPVAVAFVGWLLLIGLPIIMYWLKYYTRG